MEVKLTERTSRIEDNIENRINKAEERLESNFDKRIKQAVIQVTREQPTEPEI